MKWKNRITKARVKTGLKKTLMLVLALTFVLSTAAIAAPEASANAGITLIPSPVPVVFQARPFGYTQANAGYHNVTITNSGSHTIGAVNVWLAGYNPGAFELNGHRDILSANPISISVDQPLGQTATLTVRPRLGLPAGVYRATVFVGELNALHTQSFDVSFEVYRRNLQGATINLVGGNAREFHFTGNAIVPAIYSISVLADRGADAITMPFNNNPQVQGSLYVRHGTNILAAPNGGTIRVEARAGGNFSDVINQNMSEILTFDILKAGSRPISWPTATSIAVGQTLRASELLGGVAPTGVGGNFYWVNPDQTPGPGDNRLLVRFRPHDQVNHQNVYENVNVRVNRANPDIRGIAYVPFGETLTVTHLNAIRAYANTSINAPRVLGDFAWVSPPAAGTLNVGDHSLPVTFTPWNLFENDVATGAVTVRVVPKSINNIVAPSMGTMSFGQTLGEASLTGGTPGGTWVWVNAQGGNINYQRPTSADPNGTRRQMGFIPDNRGNFSNLEMIPIGAPVTPSVNTPPLVH